MVVDLWLLRTPSAKVVGHGKDKASNNVLQYLSLPTSITRKKEKVKE